MRESAVSLRESPQSVGGKATSHEPVGSFPCTGSQHEKETHESVSLFVVKRTTANKNIIIYKVNNTELFCQVELSLSDYPLYGKQITAS